MQRSATHYGYGMSNDQPVDSGNAMSRSLSAHPMLYSGASETPWAVGFSPNLGFKLDLPPADELLEPPELIRDSLDGGFAFANPSATSSWGMPPTPDLADGSSYYSSAMSRTASMVSSYLPGPTGPGWAGALGADTTDFLRHDKSQFNYMGSVFEPTLISPDEGHSQFSNFSFSHANPDHRSTFGGADMARDISNMSSSTTFSHDPHDPLSSIGTDLPLSPTDVSPRRASSSSSTAGATISPSSSNKMEIPRCHRTAPAASSNGHRKILCDKCDAHPEGFRGDHELTRHKRLFHSSKTSKWVCVDLHAVDGVEIGTDWSRPKLSLDDCQNCRNGKQYGQYYNAAAHLRRFHFHPKPRGRPKGDARQRRAGSAGGSEPSINMLKKYWLRCIVVRNDNVDDKPQRVDEEAEDEVDDDEEEAVVLDNALVRRTAKDRLQRHYHPMPTWDVGQNEEEDTRTVASAETVAMGWRPRTIGRLGANEHFMPVY